MSGHRQCGLSLCVCIVGVHRERVLVMLEGRMSVCVLR